MKEGEAGNRAFENIFYGDSLIVRYLPQDIAEIKSDGAGEMNLGILIVLILHHIVLIEIRKAVVHQLVAVRLFYMLENKFGKTGQKGTGLFTLINFFQNLLARKGKPGFELFSQGGRHFVAEIIENKLFANVGT